MKGGSWVGSPRWPAGAPSTHGLLRASVSQLQDQALGPGTGVRSGGPELALVSLPVCHCPPRAPPRPPPSPPRGLLQLLLRPWAGPAQPSCLHGSPLHLHSGSGPPGSAPGCPRSGWPSWKRQGPALTTPFLSPLLNPRKQKQWVHPERWREQPSGPGAREGEPVGWSWGQWQRVGPHSAKRGGQRRLAGASCWPAQPWQQPAQPGLGRRPRAPPAAPPDKGVLGGGRAAWGAACPGAGRCPPGADRQPPVLPEGHGEPL